MCSYIYIYAPFLPNFSLGVLNPHVLVCGFLLYKKTIFPFLQEHRSNKPEVKDCLNKSNTLAKSHIYGTFPFEDRPPHFLFFIK